MTEDKKFLHTGGNDHESEGTGIRLCPGRKTERLQQQPGKGAFHFPARIKLYTLTIWKNPWESVYLNGWESSLSLPMRGAVCGKAKLILQLEP